MRLAGELLCAGIGGVRRERGAGAQSGVTTTATCASLSAFAAGMINAALSGINAVAVWSVVLFVPQILCVAVAGYIVWKTLFLPLDGDEVRVLANACVCVCVCARAGRIETHMFVSCKGCGRGPGR